MREITNMEAHGDPCRVRQVACQFTGMVFPGSEITVCAVAREAEDNLEHIHFCVLNGDGKPAVRNGRVALSR